MTTRTADCICGREYCENCRQDVLAVVAPVDPRDVRVISEFVANVSRNRNRVDCVFSLNGAVYAEVSPKHMAPWEPPDSRTYRLDRVERTIRGEDVETIVLTEVGWHDGTRQYIETGDTL